MFLQSIRTVNFRNLDSLTVDLSPGMNIFMGNNAQGKTNFMEAAVCLSDGRSFRNARIKDMIQYNKEISIVDGDIKKADISKVCLKLKIEKDSRQYFINDQLTTDLRQYIGMVNYVVFSLDNLAISSGVPKARRDFIDRAVFSVYPQYLFLLKNFRKILKNRNAVLKRKNVDRNLLQIFTRQFVDIAGKIVSYRLNYLDRIKSNIETFHNLLTGGSEVIKLEYRSSYMDQEHTSEAITDRLSERLDGLLVSEIANGITMTGPQRDDLDIFINGQDVKTFGSQGQKRCVVIALKLSELELYRQIKGEYPVLVLDDIASELDLNRQQSLLNLIPKDVQVLLSLTEMKPDIFPGSARLFNISEGKINTH